MGNEKTPGVLGRYRRLHDGAILTFFSDGYIQCHAADERWLWGRQDKNDEILKEARARNGFEEYRPPEEKIPEPRIAGDPNDLYYDFRTEEEKYTPKETLKSALEKVHELERHIICLEAHGHAQGRQIEDLKNAIRRLSGAWHRGTWGITKEMLDKAEELL